MYHVLSLLFLIVLRSTADYIEDDSDIEILNLNNKSHDEDDLGEIVARDSSVICCDDSQSDNNQNYATSSQTNNSSEYTDTPNSTSRKRKRNENVSTVTNDKIEENQIDDIGESVSRESSIIYLGDSQSECEVVDDSSSQNNEKHDAVPVLQKKKRKKKAQKKTNQENNVNCESSNMPSLQSQINIVNIQDLNNFLKNECTLRNTNLGKSVTRNLNETEWNILLNKLRTVRTHAEKKPKLRKNLLKQAKKMLLSSLKQNVS